MPSSLQPDQRLDDLTEKIPVADGYVTLTSSFKYLGSWISDTLQDECDLDVRIKKASSQMGALRPLWKCPYIPLEIKRKVYLAISSNTVLWGCESWAITEKMRRRLEAFHHRSLRMVLGITMWHVEQFGITNTRIRQEMQVPNIMDYVTKQQLQWIYKVVNMDDSRAPKKLLTSWIHHKRKVGRPQITYKNSYACALSEMLPDVDPTVGRNKDWLECAKNPAEWKAAFNEWWDSVQPLPPPNDFLR